MEYGASRNSGLGMNTASTSYGGGGATTHTTGQGYGGGNDDLLEMFKRLARQRLAPPVAPPQAGPALRARSVPRAGVKVAAPPPRPMGNQAPDYGPTPAEFGRRTMNEHGQFGFEVDPTLVPAGLQDKIHGGFYGNVGNWDSSNPQIAGERSGWGEGPRGGGAVEIGPGQDPRAQAIADAANAQTQAEAQKRMYGY